MTIRKFTCCFLVVVFLLLSVVQLPINTFAAGQDVYEYEMYDDTSVIITKYTGGVADKLVIPEEIDGFPVKAIGESAFKDAEIYYAVLPDNLEVIEDFAFWNTYLYKITIPKNVSQIGTGAFAGVLFKSYEVEFGNSEYYASEGCLMSRRESKLLSFPTAKEGEIPDAVSRISQYAFMYTFNVTDIYISQYVWSVEPYAFMNSSVQSVDIDAKVVDEYAFYGCENLADVECSIKSSISPKAFEGSAWWTAQPEGVVYIDNFVLGYKGEAPEEVELKFATWVINQRAFADQKNVRRIVISEPVHTIDFSAFEGCTSLEEIVVHEKNDRFSSNDGVVYNKKGTELLFCPEGKSGTVTIPDNVSKIDEYAFENCSKITCINIPQKMGTVGDGAFAGCTGLKQIHLPDLVSKVGDGLFCGCTALEEIMIPSGNPDFEMLDFTDTAWLEKQPDGLVYIGDSVLGYKGEWENTKEIIIEEGTKAVAEYAFVGLESVENVVLPQSLKKIGDYAFANCYSIIEFTVPAGVVEFGSCALGVKVNFHEEDREGTPELNSDVVIKGYKNSKAELYAKGYNIEFVAIGETEITKQLGDANGDSVINIKDATTIAKYLAGILWEFLDSELLNFDFNQDEHINVKDCTAIQKYLAGIPY